MKKSVNIEALKSVLKLNGMNLSEKKFNEFCTTIALESQYNPIIDFIESKPWDGVDRLEIFYDTLVCDPGFSDSFKKKLMLKWCISAVAVLLEEMKSSFKGMLILMGNESIGKTSWFRNLLPSYFGDELFNEKYIKIREKLNIKNIKDVKNIYKYWIVELVELDSMFNSEKSEELFAIVTDTTFDFKTVKFMPAKEDKITTVFGASVNSIELLNSNRNSIFWILPIIKAKYEALAGINLQQFWAQILHIYKEGKKNGLNLWYLTENELAELDKNNKPFTRKHFNRVVELAKNNKLYKDEALNKSAYDRYRKKYYE